MVLLRRFLQEDGIRHLKFRRFEIGIGINFFPIPSKNIKEWIFSPDGRFVWPGKDITGNSRSQIPEGKIHKSTVKIVDDNFYARFYLLGGAIRILGIDLGAEIFYLPKNEDCK